MKNKNHKQEKEQILFSDDAIGLYIKRIYDFSLINLEEEKELIKRIKKGDHSAEVELIQANLRLVLYLCKKYPVDSSLKNDLVAAGNKGLVMAGKRMKSYKGKSKFCSYAGGYIHNEIRQTITKYYRSLEIFPCSLDQPLKASDKKSVLSDRPPKIDFETPERMRLKAVFEIILNTLPQREAKIIRIYFGLDGGGGLTLREMETKVGLSFARIGQLLEKGLDRLRHPSRSRRLAFYLQLLNA